MPYGTSSGTSYSDQGVAFGQTYFYVVQAVVNAIPSGNSNEVSGSPQQAPPRTAKTGNDKGRCGCAAASPSGPLFQISGTLALLILGMTCRRERFRGIAARPLLSRKSPWPRQSRMSRPPFKEANPKARVCGPSLRGRSASFNRISPVFRGPDHGSFMEGCLEPQARAIGKGAR
jgi:hypothetical protein